MWPNYNVRIRWIRLKRVWNTGEKTLSWGLVFETGPFYRIQKFWLSFNLIVSSMVDSPLWQPQLSVNILEWLWIVPADGFTFLIKKKFPLITDSLFSILEERSCHDLVCLGSRIFFRRTKVKLLFAILFKLSFYFYKLSVLYFVLKIHLHR